MYECRYDKTKNTKVDIFPDPKNICKYNVPWKFVNLTNTAWAKLIPSQRGKQVSEEMKEYWEKVKSIMESQGGFKPTADEILTEHTYVNP